MSNLTKLALTLSGVVTGIAIVIAVKKVIKAIKSKPREVYLYPDFDDPFTCEWGRGTTKDDFDFDM